jgi:hypothetical protein
MLICRLALLLIMKIKKLKNDLYQMVKAYFPMVQTIVTRYSMQKSTCLQMNKDLHIYWINSCCTILFQASRINYYILTNGPVVFCESLPSKNVYYISTKFRMQKPMMLKVEKLQRIQKSLAKHILQHLQAMGDLV